MAYCEDYIELISAALDGVLSPAEQEKLTAHLSTCRECQKLYDDLAALRSAMSGLPPVSVPPELKERIMDAVAAEAQDAKVVPFAPAEKKASSIRWQRWLASAAVLAIAVLGTWSWKPWESRSDVALPHFNETTVSDRGVGSSSHPVTKAAGAAPAAPIVPTPAPPPQPEPASAPVEVSAPTEEGAAAPFSDNSGDALTEFRDANAGMGHGSIKVKTAAPTGGDISAFSSESPSAESAYGFTSVGQAPDASLPEESSSLQTVPIQSNASVSSISGDSQPTAMPRLFSIAPAAAHSAPVLPSTGEEEVSEQSVTSQTDAVNVLVNYIYEFVGTVEPVEDSQDGCYAVDSPTGVSGTVTCAGEDEEVYLLDYQDDLSPDIFHYTVNKRTGEVILLEQEELSDSAF